MTGKIFLSGGGDEHDSQILDGYFFDAIPEGGMVLYVATGIHADKRMEHAMDWMTDMITMHGRSDINFFMADALPDVPHLSDYAAVYIGGGDIDTIMDEFDRTGFEFKLQDYSQHGGVIYGGGAGAVVLGKFIDTCREVRREFKTGVGLLGRYSVCVDYRDENKEGWPTSHDSLLLCLPKGAGVVIEDGKITREASRNYKIFEI